VELKKYVDTASIPDDSQVFEKESSVETATSLRRGSVSMKRIATGALLWCALIALTAAGAINLDKMWEYPPVSLRYETPVSGQAAFQARKYAIEHSGDDTYWPTFWHETEATIACEYRQIDATCILFSGDASLVWAARYLAGSAPGVTDGSGCALSSALARELWGGTDVTEKSVAIDGVTRTVRGVFEGEELIALVSFRDEDRGPGFTAVELSGGPSAPASGDVADFAVRAGLGVPDRLLLGAPAVLAAVLSVLPILILAVYWIALCCGMLKKYPAVMRGVTLVVLIGFALLLPRILAAVPDWMTPSRWSDFSFWGSLAKQIGGDLKEYLRLRPALRDIEYNILLLKQIGIAFLSSSCALIVCLRNRAKYN